MKALISADELARDVAGAEAMLDRHMEKKGELDAQEDSFKASTQFGQELIAGGHYQFEEVKDIVRDVVMEGGEEGRAGEGKEGGAGEGRREGLGSTVFLKCIYSPHYVP